MQPHIPYLLLADDDAEDRDLFTEAFLKQNPGFAIEHASCGKDVLDFLCKATELPVVLVLDYQMPDLNGPEVLQFLAASQRYRDVVKVMWSTSRRVKDMEECKKLGASYYLVKPADNRELDNMIRQMTAILDFEVRTKCGRISTAVNY